MTPVVLVGLMGPVKSTVGELVADNSGLTHVDVDHVIEDRTRKTVRQLWQEGGEAAYRQLESDVALDPLLGEHPLEVLTEKADARAELYQQVANVVVDTGHRDAETVAILIVGALRARQSCA